MHDYYILFIDGHSLKYKEYRTTATCKEEAINNIYLDWGDFDHEIINVIQED